MEKEKLIDFLDRIFLERLEKHQENSRKERDDAINALNSGDNVDVYKLLRNDMYETTLLPEWIEENVDSFLALEEFRFTKKINIIQLPTYISLEGDKTLAPAEGIFSDNRTKAVTTMSYVIGNQMETHYFPEVVNLYTISSSPKIYDNSQVEEMIKKNNKVHVLPPKIDEINFQPKNEIRFSWNPEEVLLDLTPEEWRKEILKQVEDALISYESTIPYTKKYIIRGTHLERESILKKD